MKISIITVVYNGEKYIESCINSVLSQDYDDVEYIVIDGASKDGTADIVKGFGDKVDVFISEPDKGIYDAMNKGLAKATGDIIGILNADDYFTTEGTLSTIAKAFRENETDTVFGNLVYVRPNDPTKIVRFYSPKKFKLDHLRKGDMPPHPTFYVKRKHYENLGGYKTDYKICADFEIMLRFLLKNKLSFHYIPETLVTMRTGGVSTDGIKSTLTVNKEIKRACDENDVSTSMARIYSKYFTKIFQLINRPEKV